MDYNYNTPLQPSASLQTAARCGLLTGIAAAVAIAATFYSFGRPLMLVIAVAGYVGVPVILWRALSSVMGRTDGEASFAHLWRTGTLTMAAGGLVLAILAFVFLKWIDPGFLAGLIEHINRIYTDLGTAEATEKLAELNRTIRENGMPTAAGVALQMFVSTVLSGTIAAIVMAALLRARAGRYRNTPPAFH